LYRYFSVTEARFGIITNGIIYKFYSDIEESNKMDKKPFFEFNLLNFEEHHLEELKKFTKSSFNLESIISTASTLKYTAAIKKTFAEEISNPSDEFIKFFVSKVYSGVKTQNIISQFSKIVKNALNQFIREKINDRLKSALNDESNDEEQESSDVNSKNENKQVDDGIITTDEEIEGYNYIKAIVRDVIDVNRIHMRDTKSYCGVLLDDNNRKPICRLHFNSTTKKYIGIFSQKNETKNLIDEVKDIFNHSKEIQNAVLEYIEREKANTPKNEEIKLLKY
ncbi:restriction endonuclease or methylase, partial [Candidatus Magnetomorum sp. HK-1]